MKINISKKDDRYYTTLKNNYNGVESKMYITVQMQKGLDIEYGVYDVNCFLSCYTAKDGTVKPKIIVTSFKDKEMEEENLIDKPIPDIYKDFGDTVSVDDNFLD